MKKYFNSTDARSLINTYGFSLFPIHGIDDNGNCTCGHASCTNKGKHPATNDGFKSATNNIDDLLVMWNKRQHLNVGVATGAKSGIFVIDIDSKEGEEALYGLGNIPNTLTVSTSKGKHLYFKYPNEEVTTKRGIIEGVDVRGDGGYVAGVGSNHASGLLYTFNNELEVIEEAPEFILDLVVKSRQKRRVHNVDMLTTQAPTFLSHSNDGWSVDDARGLLSHISPDVGYDEWVQIGMAIHSEGLPFHLWDDWSKSGSKYDGSTGNHWKSFNPGKGVSFGTVVHMAKEGGWKPTKSFEHSVIQPAIDKMMEIVKKEEREQVEKVVADFDPTLTTSFGKDSKPIMTIDTATGEVTPSKPRTIQYIHSDDIEPLLDCNDFVQDLMGEEQMSVVYGESNCGKTFFLADLAFHVAMGREWREKRVDQGTVIYVPLEGAKGFRNRISAFKQENMVNTMPLVIVPSPIDFMNPEGNINEFIEVIKEIEQDNGGVKLIVIDTLARALMGGDENSGQDMGMLVGHSDKIRAHTGAHICFVHHSGKDALKGARGHSSLRAAVDTEIEIKREKDANYSTISVVKQREMEMIEDMHFMLKSVTLGQNQYEEDVNSCIVLPVEAPEEVAKTVKLSASEEFVYDALVAAIIDKGEERQMSREGKHISISYLELHKAMEERGSKDMDKKDGTSNVKAITEAARKSLKHKKRANFNRNHLWLIGDYTLGKDD